ncbi:hypothetical protein HELRODRAFT_172466 [Helobdella robusta]|uniref:Uncharacterized protein n=1 Tax=Helobdella robusta TaxID=6412 RepID=T1F5D0_HELRO|nr:hypothetical protein HELRODRAFT_172466 [Helobdella robusta]ESO04793.1 hypothetical protein HELRODRAFT_172466 [Helobdella robusta]
MTQTDLNIAWNNYIYYVNEHASDVKAKLDSLKSFLSTFSKSQRPGEKHDNLLGGHNNKQNDNNNRRHNHNNNSFRFKVANILVQEYIDTSESKKKLTRDKSSAVCCWRGSKMSSSMD